MLNSSKNRNKGSLMEDPKLIAVIKNTMSKQEMDESGEHWANHQGRYMTVAETLAYAANRGKEVVPASTVGNTDLASVVSMTTYEVSYWTKKFGCTEAQLIDATKAVGTMAVDIEEYLKK